MTAAPAPAAPPHPFRSRWVSALLVPYLLLLLAVPVLDWCFSTHRALQATYELDNFWMSDELVAPAGRDTAIAQRDALIGRLRTKLGQLGPPATHPAIGAVAHDTALTWNVLGLPHRLSGFRRAYPRLCRLVVANTSGQALAEVSAVVPTGAYYEFETPRHQLRAGLTDSSVALGTLAAGATCAVQLWLPPAKASAASWPALGLPGLRVTWPAGQVAAQQASFLTGTLYWLHEFDFLAYLLFLYGLLWFWYFTVRPWYRARRPPPPPDSADQAPHPAA